MHRPTRLAARDQVAMEPMQLSQTRFVKIDGTHVTAAVDTAEDARIAVKELRHKKRELTHLKRALVRQRKAAQAAAARAARRRKSKPKGFLAKTGAVIDFLASLPAVFGRGEARMDLPALEREVKRTDEILHNLDTVRLQIEGKLLHLT